MKLNNHQIWIVIISCIIHHALDATWAAHTLASMSLEEKIAQLMVVAAVSTTDELNRPFLTDPLNQYITDREYVTSLITDYHVGGIIFLGSGRIQEQIELTRTWQSLSTIPLMVAQDCEWGLRMRLIDGMRFPYAMTLGALHDDSLIYDIGYALGKQAQSAGIHMILGPVVDVNSSPCNQILAARSFGNDTDTVAHKGSRMLCGIQDAGLLACAKHFPGRGDAQADPHEALTMMPYDRAHLATFGLPPFVHAIRHNVAAIMTGHFILPAITGSQPATVSRTLVHDLLRKDLGFRGLIITDGLGMYGITLSYSPGALEVAALRAGHDILLLPVDVPHAITAIKAAVECGDIGEDELDEHVLRVLQAKENLIAQIPASFCPSYQPDILYADDAQQLKQHAYQEAVTLVQCNKQVSYKHCLNDQYTLVIAGTTQKTVFERSISSQCNIPCLYNQLPDVTHTQGIILGLFNIHQHKQRMYGLDLELMRTVRAYKHRGINVIACLFGSPYCLPIIRDCANTVFIAYEDDPDAQKAVAACLLGEALPTGTLPVIV